MALDSVVRLKQLHNAEVSGFVVDIILQYLKSGIITGIATGSGVLTGSYYPLNSNPANYVTSGSLSGLDYASHTDLSNSVTSIQAWTNAHYYPISNPTGYLTAADLSGMGIVSGGYTFVGVGGISVTGVGNVIYISGNGSGSGSVLTGNYVPWNMFQSGVPSVNGFQYFRLKDLLSPASFHFTQQQEYYLQGTRSGAPSENYIIDLYGNQAGLGAPTGTPYIYGFDIYAGRLTSSGKPVLTTGDLSYLVTQSQLTISSGVLRNDISRINNMLTGVTGVSGEFSLVGTGGVSLIPSGNIIYVSGNMGVANLVVTGKNLSGNVSLVGVGGTQLSTSGNSILINGGISPNVVYTTGDQSLSGIKTFTNDIIARSKIYGDLGDLILDGYHSSASPNHGFNVVVHGGNGVGNIVGTAGRGGQLYLFGGDGNIATAYPCYGGDVVIRGGYGLSVGGAVYIQGATNLAAYYNSVFLNPSGGFVAINHNNPQYALDVSGTGNFSHGLFVSGVPVMTGASSLALANLVYTTGNQTISGIKSFPTAILSSGYIDTLNIYVRNLMYDNLGGGFDFNGQQIYNNAGPCLDWKYRTLLAYTPLADEFYNSLDWNNCVLNDNTENPSLNWNTHQLTGIWYADKLNISGPAVINGLTTFSTTAGVIGDVKISNSVNGNFLQFATDGSLTPLIRSNNASSGLQSLIIGFSALALYGGNVGINLTTPAVYTLDVNGAISNSTSNTYYLGSDRIAFNTNLGFYNPNPQYQIDLNGRMGNSSGVLQLNSETSISSETYALGLPQRFVMSNAKIGSGVFTWQSGTTNWTNSGFTILYGGPSVPTIVYSGSNAMQATLGANQDIFATGLSWTNFGTPWTGIGGTLTPVFSHATPTGSALNVYGNTNFSGRVSISGTDINNLFYPRNNNISGFITGFNSGLYTLNANTGIFITTGQTGAFGGSANTGTLTGVFYPRTGNPAGYITNSSASGNFIPLKGDFFATGKDYYYPTIVQSSQKAPYLSDTLYNSQLILGDNSSPYGASISIVNSFSPPYLSQNLGSINIQTNQLSIVDPNYYADGFLRIDSAAGLLTLGDFNSDRNGTWIQLDDVNSQIVMASQNPVLIGGGLAGALSHASIYVRSNKRDFKQTGNMYMSSVPSGYIFLIDSMEVITTDIVNPRQAPTVSFGYTNNFSGCLNPTQTTSNVKYARHIFDNPQDALASGLNVYGTINIASTADAHSGYFAFKGYLIPQ